MLACYNIAGVTVAMETFGRTLRQAEPYRIPEAGVTDICVCSHAENLRMRYPHLDLDSCEYLSTGNSFYRQLPRFDGMLLHASAVVTEGRAYLFSAHSGTGKSTHTALWQQVLGADNAAILNDDKPAIRQENGQFFAYGTPWSGKTDLNRNMRVPLGGICMLCRGADNSIHPYGGAEAIHAILAQTTRLRDEVLMNRLMDLIVSLLEHIPVWRMECNMNPEAALLSYRTMTGKPV